jgi:hypothetical protein
MNGCFEVCGLLCTFLYSDSLGFLHLQAECFDVESRQLNVFTNTLAYIFADEDYELEMVADAGITYEQFRSIIESLLMDSGYFHGQQLATPIGRCKAFLSPNSES